MLHRTFILLTLLASTPAFGDERIVTLSVPGMYCPSCPYIVESVIRDLDGIREVWIDSGAKTAQVAFDEDLISVEDIQWATGDAGYKSSLIGENDPSAEVRD